MRNFLYYSLMLLLGFAWYMYGQQLLRKGRRDENDELTKAPVGPFGFVVTAVISCCLLFALLRAAIRREISCLGKACHGQIYTLAEHAGDYWANMFFLLWIVLGLGYAMYVTLRIWFRD